MDESIPKALPAKRFKGPRTVMALILREMETTYGRSPGGYIWAILEPIGAITLFTLVIALGLRLRNPSIGSNFMLFYATGFLPYVLFTQTNIRVARSLRFSRQLLRYPRVTYVDAIMGRFIVYLITHLMVFYILMTGIHIGFSLPVHLDVQAIALAIAMSATLGLGVGTLNCFLMSFFPVWENIWKIMMRPFLLLSTVIYIFEEIPWQFQDVLWYNPLVHIIGLMRRGFYPSYDADYVSVVYVFGVALTPLALGLVLLHRWNRVLMNRG